MKILSTGELIFNYVMNACGILIALIALYPLYYVFIASLSKPYFVENGEVLFRVIGFTLDSYRQAFLKNSIWLAYANTVFYTLVGVLFNMVFTATMAYALSKRRLVGRKYLTLFVVFTMWFSAGIIPLYMAFRDYHLLNTRFAILAGFAMNTYNLIILKSFFEQVPSSLEEAIAELEKDRFILDVLGSHVSEKYIEAKKLEWAEYKMRVSQWETDHYLMKY